MTSRDKKLHLLFGSVNSLEIVLENWTRQLCSAPTTLFRLPTVFGRQSRRIDPAHLRRKLFVPAFENGKLLTYSPLSTLFAAKPLGRSIRFKTPRPQALLFGLKGFSSAQQQNCCTDSNRTGIVILSFVSKSKPLKPA
jgi:hypothetical protein